MAPAHHASTTRPPTPNWLKAWYALLVFTAFVVTVSLLISRG